VKEGDVRPLPAVTGSRNDIHALFDRFVAQLLGRQAGVHDQTLAALTSQSLPAIRAYLEGRAAYRRAHNDEAIRGFARALDIDSTFALAALDLAVATTKLIRQQRVCLNNTCRSASVVPGFRDSGPESDDARFDRAVRLAWESRSKLGSRDRPLLDALRGPHWPSVSTARETLAYLDTAVDAAPDRADTQYLFGLLLLYQGPAIGYSDALDQAEARFLRALALDLAYLSPLARLVDVAAYAGDSGKLRRIGTQYLSRDSSGATADYVRWRVAVGTGDASAARPIRARFDSLDLATLSQIVTASQMTGAALDDADSAAVVIIRRTTDPWERSSALYWGHMLALNRGHPHRADSLLRLRAELDSAPFFFSRAFTTWDALLGQGDSAEAETGARVRARLLARDTVSQPARRPNSTVAPAARNAIQAGSQDARDAAFQEAIWEWAHGRLASSTNLTHWLRGHGDSVRADVSDMLIASDARRNDAAALRARLDSAARSGCCRPPNHIDLMLAIAFERAGNDTAALRAVRRGQWRFPTMYLATYLRMEGRLAARVGDTTGAIRAYRHYLALRSNPEPHLRAGADSVRAELARLGSPR
jgi:hypothetical protein